MVQGMPTYVAMQPKLFAFLLLGRCNMVDIYMVYVKYISLFNLCQSFFCVRSTMFPEKIKALRESRGLYQKDIAALLELGQNSYSNYETGRAEPSIANLCKLADFFGISIDELVGHIQPRTTDSEEADRLAILSSLARQLGREDQEKLCEIAKAFVSLQKNCTDK